MTPPLAPAAQEGAAHSFLAPQASDLEARHLWHGYPDECYALTSFADSLVALAWGHGWYPQPPIVGLRNAIVVDFASPTEAAAGASIARGWNGARELPMGAVNAIASRAETNQQNARLERQLTLIGTAMRQDEFQEAVIEQLLDRRTHRGCSPCAGRTERSLADVFSILAHGTDQAGVALFSRWRPGRELIERLQDEGISLRHYRLDAIPRADLEANRFYHIWDGTPRQAEEFRKTVWAPTWKQPSLRGDGWHPIRESRKDTNMAAGYSKDKIDTKLTCKKHPKYMALRRPTADCQPCRDMFVDAERNRRLR
jgi:hypothetical protein